MEFLKKRWRLFVFLFTFFTLVSLLYGSQKESRQDVFHTIYNTLLCNEALGQTGEDQITGEESQQLESLDGLSDEQIVDIYLHKPWMLPSDISEAEWEKIRNLVYSPESEGN